jgi:Dullard-like phosphatase family protein
MAVTSQRGEAAQFERGEGASGSVDASRAISRGALSRQRHSGGPGSGFPGPGSRCGSQSHTPDPGGRQPHASVVVPPLSTGHGYASRRKTLVLDLDETLVHSQFNPTRHFDVQLDIMIDRFSTVFFVSKRPYLDVFLRTAALWYNLVIYTASLEVYADPLISCIDPDGLVGRRLFRASCLKRGGSFVKDLTLIEPDLRDVIIVDNTPAAYCMFDANAIPIEPWFDDRKDEELLNLLPLLHAVAFLEDVRSLLGLRLTKGVLAARRPQSRAAGTRMGGRASASRQERER